MMMTVKVRIAMVALFGVMVLIFEKQGADDIYRQSEAGHNDGFIEMDRKRVQQPVNGFTGHEQGDAAENDRAGKGPQNGDFAGPETVTHIAGMPAGNRVSADRDEKSS